MTILTSAAKQKLCQQCPQRRNFFCTRHGDEVRRLIKTQSTCEGWGDVIDNRPGIDDPVLIAIPARDCEELTFQCLSHLAMYAGIPFHVLYIDDGSKSGVAERVQRKAEALNIQIKVMHFDQSIGFSRACNIAFATPGYRHVLLLNNDCFVGPDCIPRMRQWLESDPKIAAVGPMTGDNGSLSLANTLRRERSGIKTELTDRYDAVHGAKLCQAASITVENRLSFFCTMFKATAIADVGVQNTHPDLAYGLGADDDWSDRAKKKGWKLAACCNAFAAHLHSSSFAHHKIDRKQASKTALAHLHSTKTKPPTLSIITRCHVDRPHGFRVLSESIKSQTVPGIEHVLIQSPGQIGIPGANRLLASGQAVNDVNGDYVQVIDDDDFIKSPDYLERLQRFIVDQGYPEWVMVRGKIDVRTFPSPWGIEWQPVRATVACFCIIVSRRLWEQHHAAWGVDKCGDWNFSKALWHAGNRPVWFDFEGCESQNGHSNGHGEGNQPRPVVTSKPRKSSPFDCDVVIPYHPAAFEWVEQAVLSILNQNDAKPLIHLIADGFPISDDILRHKFNNMPNVRKYRNQNSVGPFVSTMRALKWFETDYIMPHDSDDYALPDRIRISLDQMRETGADLFGAAMTQFIDYRWSSELVERIYKKEPVIYSGIKNRRTPKGNAIHATLCIKKTAFEKLNGYFDSLTSADTHLVRRAGDAGMMLTTTDRVVALRRLHSQSLSHGKRSGIGSPELEKIHALYEEHYRQIEAGASPSLFGRLNLHRESSEFQREGIVDAV